MPELATGHESAASIYARAVESFAAGLLRFWRAEAAYARLTCALIDFRGSIASRGDDLDGNPFEACLLHP